MKKKYLAAHVARMDDQEITKKLPNGEIEMPESTTAILIKYIQLKGVTFRVREKAEVIHLT